ncbi:hypothetical protein ACIA8O_26065 [Kitasatospora sp. NPDC051853]|uniref:hypothetical protein n=1 Tax=Kitasatospora sp. NPDC051853 TaxID=3364058 RepID=UPI0037BCC765
MTLAPGTWCAVYLPPLWAPETPAGGLAEEDLPEDVRGREEALRVEFRRALDYRRYLDRPRKT